MPQWLNFLGGVSSLGVGIVFWLYYYKRVLKFKESFNELQLSSSNNNSQATFNTKDHNINKEQFIRNCQFFGENGLEKIQRSFVVIVGVGGVGSHCAVSLARSGILHIKMIDFDKVSLSSLNRHACATRLDVGVFKVKCLQNHIHQISPEARIEIAEEMFCEQHAERLLYGTDVNGNLKKPDYIIDCIDNTPTKTELIMFCHKKKIPIISSGGAGGKADPTKIRIDDISDTTEDDLCRVIRQRLKKMGVSNGPKFCYSTEREVKDLVPLHHSEITSKDEHPLRDGFRIRVVPVIAPLPAIFGQAICSYTLCALADKKIRSFEEKRESTKEAEALAKMNRKNFKQLYGSIKQFAFQENILTKSQLSQLELSFDVSKQLYSVIFHGSSAISGKETNPRDLQCVPWRKYGDSLLKSFLQPQNLICITQQEAKKHLKLFKKDSIALTLEDIWGSSIVERVDLIIQNNLNNYNFTEDEEE